MTRKIHFQKETPKLFDQDADFNLENSFSNSQRMFFHMEAGSNSKPSKRFQTEYVDIPKIGKKLNLLPPHSFQHHSKISQSFHKISKTELSETCSANCGSFSIGEREIKEPQNNIRDLSPNSMKDSRRKTITDFVAFFFSRKYTKSAKVSKFMQKIVFPHFVSILISILLIIVQEAYNKICFISGCHCKKDLSVKIYTTFRACFVYWNLIIILGYITIFHVEFLKRIRFLKYFYVGTCYAMIGYFYFSTDCTDEEPNFIYLLSLGALGIGLFLFIYLVKIKFNLKLFFYTTSTRVNILTLVFLNYLMNSHGYRYLRSLIEIISPFDSVNVFQVALAICIFIFRSLFKLTFYKYAENEGISEKIKLDSIGYFVRVCVCIISATEISNVLELDLSYWGVWVMLINHIFFLLVFYTRYNVPLILLNKIIKILFHKDEFYKESQAEKLVDKLLSGYMIDFQFILIPRLLTLLIFRRWLNNHLPLFYAQCNFEISETFIIRKEMACIILAINISITAFIFIWMYKKNKDFFVYIPEKINILKRAYIILMVHNYFEYVMQELRHVNFEK